MSLLTSFFNLIKPAKTDGVKVADFNENMDIIDTEMHRPPLTVNGISPNPTTRDLTITEVPLAGNLSSDIAQVVVGSFVQRTSGGGSAIEDGEAFLNSVKGNMVLSGYVAESITPTTTGELTVDIDRDVFVSQVSTSQTLVFTYSTGWSVDPETYGITVNGTPVANDTITVVYVKGNLGTYTATLPTSFNSTGWNLYNNANGVKYARVAKYSDEYGYKIGGNYSLVEFSSTVNGTRTSVTVSTSGLFNVPSDGFVFVSGGDATTYIYATWSDWVDGYEGDFEQYTVSTINLTAGAICFPNGMFAVHGVRDEININTKSAINRIGRIANTASNLDDIIDSGADYVVDANFIYYVLAEPTITPDLDIEGAYAVSDHGIEFITGTTIPAVAETLYGENLKDKLRTNVLTISAQELSPSQQIQVRQNIGAAEETEVTAIQEYLDGLFTTVAYSQNGSTIAAGGTASYSFSIAKEGYTPVCVSSVTVSSSGTAAIAYYSQNATNATVKLVNNAAAATTPNKVGVYILYFKNPITNA